MRLAGAMTFVTLLAGVVGAYLGRTFAPTHPAVSSGLDSRAVQQIVANYIRTHPGDVADSLESERMREVLQDQAQPAALIRSHFTEIFSDPGSPIIGNPKGDLNIAEFFDFRCPYCKSTAPLLEQLRAHNQRVRIVLKNIPVLGPDSVYAARLGLGAASLGRFADFYNAVFQLVPGHGDRTAIDAAVESLGLNPAALYARSQTTAINSAIERDLRLAEALKITGTPALIVGDKLLLGAPTREQLNVAVSAMTTPLNSQAATHHRNARHLEHSSDDLARSIWTRSALPLTLYSDFARIAFRR